MKLYVVTVAYQSGAHLPTFLRCVEDAAKVCAQESIDVNTIVVDNASPDDSCEIVRSYAAQATHRVALLSTGVNGGFAYGTNCGIRAALSDQADYVLLLNNDVAFDSSFLRSLVTAHHRWGPDAVVSPQISMMTPRDHVWYDGGRISRLNAYRAVHEHLGEPFPDAPLAERTTGYVSGCAILVPRHVWLAVGLLDEDFFIYGEDVDFAMRLLTAGVQLVVTPETRLLHRVGSGYAGERSETWIRWETYGRVLVVRKHAPRPLTRNLMYCILFAWITWVRLDGRETTAHWRIRVAAFRAALSAPQAEAPPRFLSAESQTSRPVDVSNLHPPQA